MAEYTNIGPVTVAAGQNVPLTETAVSGGSCIVHREGAGVVTLRGQTNSVGRGIKSVLVGILQSPPEGPWLRSLLLYL